MDATPVHVPVMLKEALEHLAARCGGVYLDGTAGGGGHAAALWERIRPGGRLILLDRDHGALERLKARFGREGGLTYCHANFCDFDKALIQAGEERFDGALLDLGVSSLQLADAERGFSFERSGPLDMRYDRSQELTAFEIVNRWDAEDLASLFSAYGDQPYARRIARAIVQTRGRQPIRRTDELADVVTVAQPARYRRRKRIHPATRIFQALRMAVNDEPRSLDMFCRKIFDYLKPGGRAVVIAFHSGEDRIVKNRFREAVRAGVAELLVRKPITPDPDEVRANPRSRSARLRVAARLAPRVGLS
ncbi:MAG TPA: 16S rRNA (cytosine(1402)-N(4))-methyltransferase RsmH [Phycisphaerae bacterium]|nr:16S rRNA (cytosine(1402)-N(4))-methyltransferase RsmH [Phycisphaerae bacterium]